ncbi:hypothetical protein Ctaglu_17340 [Clostridium tagluense]|uniref:Uncharacterized protein n=1 Tax=Clostridium tagluense TaxID=360422 RepID=A0A401UKM9_9CLOT|nr:hypothetical protein Ctaglu_17340 [Clostridium tagluense]
MPIENNLEDHNYFYYVLLKTMDLATVSFGRKAQLGLLSVGEDHFCQLVIYPKALIYKTFLQLCR